MNLGHIGDDEIRIVELHPANQGSALRWETRVVSLASSPEFEALSYVWGSPLDVVEVPGSSIKITKSLYAALHRLRLEDETRLLWVDQMCINQNDIKEKASQVQLMRAIYSKCTRCLIWMGQADVSCPLSDAAKAVSFLEYLAALNNADDQSSVPVPAFVTSEHEFLAALKALRTISVQEGPWWRRVWTVQEAIIPRDLLFLWGPFTLPWQTMIEAAWGFINFYGDVRDVGETGDMGHLSAQLIWLNGSKDDGDPPIGITMHWRFRKATDPLDNVYALNGLFSPGEMPRVSNCDYSLSPARVFTDFTLDLMTIYGLLPPTFDTYLEDDIATAGLPRWALDMKSWPKYRTNEWNRYSGYDIYQANKGLPEADFSYNAEGTLDLDGNFIDTIKAIGDGHYVEEWVDEPTVPLLPTIRSWWDLYVSEYINKLSSTTEPDHSTALRLFHRLLIGDVVSTSDWDIERLATDEDVDLVSEFLESGEEDRRPHATDGMARNQRFFFTRSGLMGLGRLDTKPGDEVWVFNQGRTPFVLRPRAHRPGDSPSFDFVGVCYVQGIMQGELVNGGGSRPVQQRVRLH
ncbi:heterokaryon incompatibility protein-domain-containing protein [Ilyonectria robusta]|uniref:heterokaryon incompatibility protein-domain-containing protein n=1 Tax=Ilyonectria robusta TaxID=1079257 RepID=UPI001E8D2DD6|nr:heterokaryon incompatibility protein-domain-containing protein [Ilyonectria robusta]KAH8664888.1 heterokaryon incompatibility protein-domain-containing protein [Ilyonectria robusta]